MSASNVAGSTRSCNGRNTIRSQPAARLRSEKPPTEAQKLEAHVLETEKALEAANAHTAELEAFAADERTE
jgi:hypothetical protein